MGERNARKSGIHPSRVEIAGGRSAVRVCEVDSEHVLGRRWCCVNYRSLNRAISYSGRSQSPSKSSGGPNCKRQTTRGPSSGSIALRDSERVGVRVILTDGQTWILYPESPLELALCSDHARADESGDEELGTLSEVLAIKLVGVMLNLSLRWSKRHPIEDGCPESPGSCRPHQQRRFPVLRRQSLPIGLRFRFRWRTWIPIEAQSWRVAFRSPGQRESRLRSDAKLGGNCPERHLIEARLRCGAELFLPAMVDKVVSLNEDPDFVYPLPPAGFGASRSGRHAVDGRVERVGSRTDALAVEAQVVRCV